MSESIGGGKVIPIWEKQSNPVDPWNGVEQPDLMVVDGGGMVSEPLTPTLTIGGDPEYVYADSTDLFYEMQDFIIYIRNKTILWPKGEAPEILRELHSKSTKIIDKLTDFYQKIEG